MKRPEEAAQWLKARDHFLILTHVRPDGDTTGCAIALCLGLRSLGKDAWIWENPQFSPRFLPRMEGLLRRDTAENATIVAVDMATESLLPKGGEDFAGRFQLCIDHHPSNTFYAADTLLDASCAGCGELLYQVLTALEVEVTPAIAEAIYIAISTDTGCFRFSNTSAQTFATAAACVGHGADIAPINRQLFEIKTRGRLELESRMMAEMDFYCGGAVAICCLPQKLVEQLGVTEDDLDSISGFPRTIEGVLVGAVLRDSEPGRVKFSVRTAAGFNASAYCGALGGGGHAAAAGAAIDGTLEEGKARLLEILRRDKSLWK